MATIKFLVIILGIILVAMGLSNLLLEIKSNISLPQLLTNDVFITIVAMVCVILMLYLTFSGYTTGRNSHLYVILHSVLILAPKLVLFLLSQGKITLNFPSIEGILNWVFIVACVWIGLGYIYGGFRARPSGY